MGGIKTIPPYTCFGKNWLLLPIIYAFGVELLPFFTSKWTQKKMHFYTYRIGLYMVKIVDVKCFGNFKKKSQKWPIQDLSNIERNKVMKIQSIRGTLQGLAYDNHPGGLIWSPPCRIGLNQHPTSFIY